MKEKLIEVLTNQKEKGDALQKKLESVSNTPALDELISDYDAWDKVNGEILQNAFVQKHLFRMYSQIKHIGNAYNTSSSVFQTKRDPIIDCLPRKVKHLGTAIEHAKNLSTLDLLPFYEEIDNTIISQPINDIVMKKAFISHSNKDDEQGKILLDLLHTVGLQPNQIFYSSDPGYGVTLGEDIFDRLKKELSGDVIALFILSENYYASPVSLCEMGAVWIKSSKQIPILIPPFDFKDMKGVFQGSLGFKINDKEQLNYFKEQIELLFNLKPIPSTRWETKRDEFLTKVNALL